MLNTMLAFGIGVIIGRLIIQYIVVGQTLVSGQYRGKYSRLKREIIPCYWLPDIIRSIVKVFRNLYAEIKKVKESGDID